MISNSAMSLQILLNLYFSLLIIFCHSFNFASLLSPSCTYHLFLKLSFSQVNMLRYIICILSSTLHVEGAAQIRPHPPTSARPITMESLFAQRLASFTPELDVQEWARPTQKAQLVAEYNHAIESKENLDGITNPFELTVFSILCKSALVGKMENVCPKISDSENPAAIAKTYTILASAFPIQSVV